MLWHYASIVAWWMKKALNFNFKKWPALALSQSLALGLLLTLSSQELEAQGISSSPAKPPESPIRGPLNPLDILQVLALPNLKAQEEPPTKKSPFLSPSPKKRDPLKDYQLFLDQAAYRAFTQFSDPQLRERLWQLYFDSNHYRYESQQGYQGPSDSTIAGAEKLAQASYIPAQLLPKGSEPHLLVLSDRLKGLPTWSRFYRLQALIELAHQHQWVELLGSYERAFAPENFRAFEQASEAYSLWFRHELLSSAPQEALVEELIDAPTVPTRLALAMVYLINQAQGLPWESFGKSQLREGFGHRAKFNEALLRAVKDKIKSPSFLKDLQWEQIQSLWLEHHHERLRDETSSDLTSTYSHLRQKLQHLRQQQQPTADLLMEKALLQALGALTPPLCQAVLTQRQEAHP